MTSMNKPLRMGRSSQVINCLLAFCLLTGTAGFGAPMWGLDLAFKHKIIGRASVECDAIRGPGKGGLRDGYEVRVLSGDVTVYRLFDNDWAGMDGRFWVFESPTGDNAQYRQDYGVCTEWNALTHPVTCTLHKDTIIIVGRGQSVSCEKRPFFIRPSEALQVFIPKPKDSCRFGWALN